MQNPTAPCRNAFAFKLQGSTVFLVVGLVVFGLAVLAFSGWTLRNEVTLQKQHVHVQAIVTATRITHSKKGGTSHELRYRFDLPSGLETFTRSDETGRKDLWTTLTEEQWQAATRAGTLDVICLPSNPWVNRPTSVKDNPVSDSVCAAIALGGGPLAMAVLCLLRVFMEHKKLTRALASGQVPPKDLKWYDVQAG